MKMSFEEPENFRAKKSVLLDTCFIIHELQNQKEKRLLNFCEENTVLITSFNVEELKHVSKKLGHDKKLVKDFLKRAKLTVINIPVNPGEITKEREYVNDFDPELMKKIHDPSDAVMVVGAILSSSDILTRDKHHLFTVELEEELKEYGLRVYNDLSKYE
jgi:hypothetical protein